MYLDMQVRPQGEQVDAVAPTRFRLSAAIRKGRSMITEEKSWYGCALCAACHATGLPISLFGPGPRYQNSDIVYDHLEKATSTPREVLETVSHRHYCGETSAHLADWLESQGL